MINKKIKELRIQHNLTQKEMAEILQTSRSTYNNYEQSVATPSLETLIKIADHFHITVDNLIGHEVPYLLDKSTLSHKQQELLEEIKTLSDENCKRVQDFITGILIAEEEKQKIINMYKKGE